MSSIRTHALSLSVERLRGEIAKRSERIRVQQAELAELVAVLVERERDAAAAAGRSEAAAELGATRVVQELTGVTRKEARELAAVGSVMAPGSETPWMNGVASATREGVVSVTKAQVIGAGLGEPNERVATEDLVLAAGHLLEVAPSMTPEQLERETRAVREQLDAQHVIDEERRIQEQRSAKLYKHRDGSSTLVAKLDREATVEVAQFLDTVTGPRQSGPRFTSDAGKAYEQGIIDDPRSTEQLTHDALITIIRLGLGVNPNRLPGRRPAVRVVVTATDLEDGTGYGELEGTGQTISIAAVERIQCDTGTQPVTVDRKGKPLEYGQEQRLFTDAQRTALAIRDGGCRRASCDRPASWAEAHHIQHYAHGGATSLVNGILLCRTDHLDLHNSGAHIEYEDDRDRYVWVDADGTRTDMPSKARIQERIRANRTAA